MGFREEEVGVLVLLRQGFAEQVMSGSCYAKASQDHSASLGSAEQVLRSSAPPSEAEWRWGESNPRP